MSDASHITSYEHGGNVHAAADRRNVTVDELLDFSANINPMGAPEWLRACVSRELDSILHYPDPTAEALRRKAAERYQVAAERVLVANGSTELLYHLPTVLQCRRALIPVPCYVDYLKVMEIADIPAHLLPLAPGKAFQPDADEIDANLRPGDLLIVGSPNNPTGCVFPAEKIRQLAAAHPQVMFVVDEAFLEFVPGAVSVAGGADNIITLHSLTKFYAIPGLRLGFGVFPEDIAARLKRLLPPWSVNSLAQKVGERAIVDDTYQQESRAFFARCRSQLLAGLAPHTELLVHHSEANYLLIRMQGKLTVNQLQEKLAQRNILIRDCANYPNLGPDYFRIAVRSPAENEKFLEALGDILQGKRRRRRRKKKTPAIMFQGTSSNAGKSILTAALCRILLQDGVRVAPFKAQNMSLNSFVTRDGLEMGRAQVVQAQAARLDPDVRMNPILLKPSSDTGSQIIVHGRPIANMGVMEYVSYKEMAGKEACRSYDELAADFQAIVLEGAGSPGEVNLKAHDIVNMRMARYAESPVILVGDIDRGGVYASFIGTMEVFNQWERQLIAGFLVNRFRGDARLLEDAHDYVKAHSGKEVLGVIPYLAGHGIPEEDSVSFKEGLFDSCRPDGAHVEVALINLPHISNFTDLEPLLAEPDVYLHVVSSVDELGEPDVIVLPGSKNVIGDFAKLRSSGLAEAVLNLVESGCELVGICGGYQMLGNSIEDPHNIESHAKKSRGLSLLQMDTVLDPDKTLVRKTGTHLPSGLPVLGYEIHHGQTRTAEKPLFSYADSSLCGLASKERRVWGCYLHGLFDSDPFRRWFIDRLREKKGIGAYGGPLCSYNLEPAFDRLADSVRAGMDMDRVYQLLGL